jgi:hypothetical protein
LTTSSLAHLERCALLVLDLGLTDFGDDKDDSPDEDAIEVVVTEIGKGGKEVKQTKFFTEAEAPEQAAPGVVQ